MAMDLKKSPDSRHLSSLQDSHVPMETTPSGDPPMGILTVTIMGGKRLKDAKDAEAATMAPYCVMEYDEQQVRTRLQAGPTPTWDETFSFDVTRMEGGLSDIIVWVYNGADASGSASSLGTVTLKPPAHGESKPDWLALRRVLPQDPMPTGQISLRVRFERRNDRVKLSMDDFEILRVLGKGNFGKVLLVKKIDSSRIYAIKALKKQHLLDRGEIAHTVAERNILAKNAHPFLVSLKFSFQTDEKLYLGLDYIPGGELFVVLQKDGSFTEDRAKLYVAMLLLALDYLHERHIIYRDLKPENILIDMNGFLKLADFGLCKQTGADGRTNSFCGTPEYMVPEILQRKTYSFEVDWWTLGALLFEMLTGLPPFYDQDVQQMYQRILHQPLVCTGLSRNAEALVRGLLDRNPETRLGRATSKDLYTHPFFAGLNWSDLLAKRIHMRWLPRLMSATDTSNFDTEFTQMTPLDSKVTPSALHLSRSVQDQFTGFTFVDEKELH